MLLFLEILMSTLLLRTINPESSIPAASIKVLHASPSQQQFTSPYPALALVDKPNLTTAETAYYLNRRPQTLRGWACLENGPLRPTRIGGLLAWSTATVKALTGVAL